MKSVTYPIHTILPIILKFQLFITMPLHNSHTLHYCWKKNSTSCYTLLAAIDNIYPELGNTVSINQFQIYRSAFLQTVIYTNLLGPLTYFLESMLMSTLLDTRSL